MVCVLVGFLLVSLTLNIQYSIESADGPTQLASSSISVKINGDYPQDWPDALEWMKENVGDDERGGSLWY